MRCFSLPACCALGPVSICSMPGHARRGRRSVYSRRRLGLLAAALLLAAASAYLSASLDRSDRTSVRAAERAKRKAALPSIRTAPASTPAAPAPLATTPVAAVPVPPRLLVSVPSSPTGRWTVVARVHGAPAAWLAQRSGVTLMRFDQAFQHLTLHAGSSDGGAGGWAYGDRISPREVHLLVAAFNGGFKLTYHDVGFVSGHRVAVALKPGLASIVTYTDGKTDIGAWRSRGLPAAGKTVFSVLQNQRLLVEGGAAASTVSGCIIACWGETIGSRTVVARSGLGITATGQLVWAAGEQLTPAGLARALIGAGVVRAIELDINPAWVAGYLYVHRSSGPSPVPLVPGQSGLAGQLLVPYTRDFLAIVAN
jgi:hypothetical protein